MSKVGGGWQKSPSTCTGWLLFWVIHLIHSKRWQNQLLTLTIKLPIVKICDTPGCMLCMNWELYHILLLGQSNQMLMGKPIGCHTCHTLLLYLFLMHTLHPVRFILQNTHKYIYIHNYIICRDSMFFLKSVNLICFFSIVYALIR